MKKIVFVCTGNSCRSVMAEGLFRKYIGEKAKDYAVLSAGTGAADGFPPSEPTVNAMRQEGVDVTEHQSQRLTLDIIRQAHLLIVMEKMHKDFILQMDPKAKSKVHLLTEFSSKDKNRFSDIDIPDPIRMSESFYKNVLAAIRDGVVNFIKTL